MKLYFKRKRDSHRTVTHHGTPLRPAREEFLFRTDF
jgi:hypothetical protein